MRQVEDYPLSRPARSWGSSFVLTLLFAVAAAGLAGCQPEVAAKTDKAFTYCCTYADYQGEPE